MFSKLANVEDIQRQIVDEKLRLGKNFFWYASFCEKNIGSKIL